MTRTPTLVRWTLRVSATLALIAGTFAFGQPADPVSSDPVSADAASSARLRSFNVKSDGALLNGRALLAQGKGPHPTILLLHGMPGNELNMDVAQAARRAGWNVFTFHYRGSWGSGGEFSFSNAVADTAAFTEVSLDTDHSYSDRRIALTRTVLGWLEGQK